MISLLMLLSIVLQISPDNSSVIFYDDFSDGNISDWDQRCRSGNWSCSSGQVHGNTSYSPAALVPPGNIQYEDCSIAISGMAVHVLGMVSRLDSGDNGIIAYVSPDHNVARIRKVSNGELSTIYNSLSAPFPNYVWYELTLICEEDSLQFQIDVPSTGDSWILSATDPSPQTGQFGLLMAAEPNAHWDWISVTGADAADSMISWMYTDDTAFGNGNMAFESGEEIVLNLQLLNSESAPLTNVFAILQSLAPEIIVSDNFDEFGNIPVGNTSWGTGGYGLIAPASTPEDQAYAMQLTIFADGGYSNAVEFSIPVGCGIECDVESGMGQWSWNAVESGWLDNWHVSSARNHTSGGTQSFKCGDTGSGDYNNHLFSALTSPLLNIPIGGEVSFWIWIDAQIPLNDAAGIPACDGGLLQYGRCGTWIDLEPTDGYPYQIIPSSTGPFEEGAGVFSGQHEWSEWALIIPDSLAGPGQIRFIFGSDDTGTREGWYVDDIHIQGFVGIENPEYEEYSTPVLSAYPNPFMESLTFMVSGMPMGEVTIEIFDLAGRLVASPRLSTPGEVRTLQWNGQDIPNGIYIARVCIQGSEDLIQHIVKLD